VHECQIKSILAVLSTGTRVPVVTLREMMRPLFPEGTSLDCQLIFNFRLKIKRMLDKGIIDLASHTVTEEEERVLCCTGDDLALQQTPGYYSEVFSQCHELLKDALLDKNDLDQMISCLDSLVACDPTFAYRIAVASDGTPTGFVWQTGVMRRDFELHG